MAPHSHWLALLYVALTIPAGAWASNLFAVLDTGEFYASADGGATWSAPSALPVTDAIGLAAGATSSDLYMATRSGSIYRSTDAGGSWTPVGAIAASDIAGFTIAPSGAVLALTRTGTVYASVDQGATFDAIAGLTGSDWTNLARGPLGRLYALTETGQVAESRDQGATWATVGVVTTSDAVAIRRLGNTLYVLSRTGEIYRSLNYGANWIAVGALTSSSMAALVDLGDALVAAALEGEVASSANGAAWSWVGTVNQLHLVALATDAPMATGIAEESTAPRFLVGAPHPNPSHGLAGVSFSFSLPAPDRVRIAVYDARGRCVARRSEKAFPAGEQVTFFRWLRDDLPAGTYFVRLETASGRTASTKWTVLR